MFAENQHFGCSKPPPKTSRFAAEDLRVLQHRDALQRALGVTWNYDLQGMSWGVTR